MWCICTQQIECLRTTKDTIFVVFKLKHCFAKSIKNMGLCLCMNVPCKVINRIKHRKCKFTLKWGIKKKYLKWAKTRSLKMWKIMSPKLKKTRYGIYFGHSGDLISACLTWYDSKSSGLGSSSRSCFPWLKMFSPILSKFDHSPLSPGIWVSAMNRPHAN